MEIEFREVTSSDALVIGEMVVALTTEICASTETKHFDIDLVSTTKRCSELITAGHYAGIVAEKDDIVIATVTMSENYALYVGGKIGVIQVFYVEPPYRDSGVGSMLIEQVHQHGKRQKWSCIELCTPPLPAFERTINFYQKNGLLPVGGRKMRKSLS